MVLENFKVIDTTDDKFEGENVHLDLEILRQVKRLEYRGVKFDIERVYDDGKIVKLICSNYIAVLARI